MSEEEVVGDMQHTNYDSEYHKYTPDTYSPTKSPQYPHSYKSSNPHPLTISPPYTLSATLQLLHQHKRDEEDGEEKVVVL